MKNFHVLDHPLIQHKLTIIRDENCGTREFREVVNEIAELMVYEVSRDMPLEEVEIKTPVSKTTQKRLAGKKVVVAPILRAGIGMVDGVLELIPSAKVGHIGMYRDEETLKPHEYFVKMPDQLEDREIIVVDPMLATGGSAIMAVDALKKRGAKRIKFVCLVAAPEGVEVFAKAHSDVEIYAASLDDCLNEDGYIVPGLGDAGDRLFGTK
ncbi:uracil phosphoribosyltransferase [Ligilactobacillus hayakitensis]|uniref:uracil phosphoribosyltransferase n=1 Tax=Ligilactobacillus hayakitensis TaxID=396716 RepID=UPI0012DC5993|nr:uracil phosphoribosyltransferase [Ligilactobacillus hayakitensis]